MLKMGGRLSHIHRKIYHYKELSIILSYSLSWGPEGSLNVYIVKETEQNPDMQLLKLKAGIWV